MSFCNNWWSEKDSSAGITQRGAGVKSNHLLKVRQEVIHRRSVRQQYRKGSGLHSISRYNPKSVIQQTYIGA